MDFRQWVTGLMVALPLYMMLLTCELAGGHEDAVAMALTKPVSTLIAKKGKAGSSVRCWVAVPKQVKWVRKSRRCAA